MIKGKGFEKVVDSEIRDIVLNNTTSESRFVGEVVWTTWFIRWEKSKIEQLETTEHIFEGHMFPIPKSYDYILTQIYGNYMQLPPEKERKQTHSYKICKREM